MKIVFWMTLSTLLVLVGCNKTKSETQVPTTKEQVLEDPSLEPEKDTGDCLFDMQTQTGTFLKQIPEFANHIWDDDTKTAVITLDNEETIVVTRGGCKHFKIIGQWMRKTPKESIENTEYWFSQGQELSEKILPLGDVKRLKRLIAQKKYTTAGSERGVLFTFLDEDYKEWYFSVAKVLHEANENVFLEVICLVN